MKIVDVQAELLKTSYDAPFHPTWAPGQSFDQLLTTVVKIHTDEGVVGIGAGAAQGFEGVVGVRTLLRPALIGQDPFATERLIRVVRSAAVRMGWAWMVEMALWDLIGKVANLPVYKLWGGAFPRIRAYASWGEVRSDTQRVEDAIALQELGFGAIKVRFRHNDLRQDLKLLEALRTALGDSFGLMVDANQAEVMPGSGAYFAWDLFTARRAADALAELGVLWLEEPLPRYDYDNLRRLTERAPLPIAGGELNRGLHEFRQLIEGGCYHIVQPDAAYSEGMLQVRKIAALAEAFGVECIPHTWSNGIGLRANLQILASLPQASWLEFPLDPPSFTVAARDRMLRDPLRVESDGYVTVPNKPGLGFELDEEVMQRCRVPIELPAL